MKPTSTVARRDFLFELGTEELPPKALPALEQALGSGIATLLKAASLRHGAIQTFATPRRLALRVRRLAAQAPEQSLRRRGPPLRAAYDAAGAPTRAALAFAASCGAELSALGRERDEKGNEYLFFAGSRPGAEAVALLPGIITELLDGLPIPKRMRWGAGEAQFVRPVHWLVMLYGGEVVPATILGLAAGRDTRGHRFHAPRSLALRAPASYERTLLGRGRVIASSAARGARVRELVVAAAEQAGGRALIEPALLEEVTALVEWPVAIAGHFESRFLTLPREVLLAALQDHQRYFPLESADGALHAGFRRGQQHRQPRPVGGARRQRARGPAAARRRGLLLGAGPARAARQPGRGARARHLPGAARLARRQVAARRRAGRGARRPLRRRAGIAWRALRCCASATC